jgi:hypothetical protein
MDREKHRIGQREQQTTQNSQTSEMVHQLNASSSVSMGVVWMMKAAA